MLTRSARNLAAVAALGCAAVLCFGPAARANPGVLLPHVGKVAPLAQAQIGTVFTYAENGGGYFQHLGGANWIEFANNDGGVTFYFKEVQRGSDYVLLYDANRVLWVKVFSTTSYMRHSGTNGWVFLYNGRWN